MKLMFVAAVAFICSQICITFVSAETIEPYKPKAQEPQPIRIVYLREIPHFPQLAPEIIELPDAGIPPKPAFEVLGGELTGVTWFPDTPWLSIVTVFLPNKHGEDPAASVYSMMDCIDESPCNVIGTDWKIVGIGPTKIKLLHVPSGIDLQEMWLEDRGPPDAGVIDCREKLVEPKFKWWTPMDLMHDWRTL